MSTRPYLGTNVSPASADELRQRGILEEDELLLALFDGVLLDDKRRRIGGFSLSDFVALTDRRLITWARGFFNDTVDSFPWQDVDVAKAETWDPWHGRIIMAFRLPAVAPRTRRIAVRGTGTDRAQGERVIVNTLDYMPADDVTPLSNMIAWTGDQIVAGLTGERLVATFAEQFPAPDRMAAMSAYFTPTPPAPPAPPKADKPRRRWWQRAVDGSEDTPKTTGNLIADYENRRSSLPVGDSTPALPMAGQMMAPGQMPLIVEQPNMYGVSRTLRLFLEAPRRLAHSVRRAGEVMSGATDLVSGMQDPQVRRNAMFGIYQAAAQQEASDGPFASVGPVVRAVVRFADPLPDEATETKAQTQTQGRRNRIEVRTPTRRAAPTLAEAQPAAAPTASPPPTVTVSSGPVRRSIMVRRTEAMAAEPAPQEPAPKEPAPEAPAVESVAPAAQRIPVRRLAISRAGEESAPTQQPVAASVNDGEL